jgi:hypothetical protein
MKRLQTLRDQLDHFHHTQNFGDSEDIETIKKFLALRIREAESRLGCKQWLKSEAA